MNMNFINAMHVLSKITEGKADHYDEYKQYVLDHKSRVQQFADWLKENLPELFDEVDVSAFDEVIREHDESKFSEEEFVPYADHWMTDKDEYVYEPDYEAAWEHHWMTNEHHPEHWLGQDIPYIYILEMLCDWGSFSIAKKNFRELISYYYNEARDDDEKNLSSNTKKIIEEILSEIASVIDGED